MTSAPELALDHGSSLAFALDVVEADLRTYALPPSAADHSVVARCVQPVLDIGCGPGRFVEDLIGNGVDVLGIDLAPAAVSGSSHAGLPILRRDVFAHQLGEAQWATALLIDGNIGIGGDPLQLLRRCASLLRAGGQLLIETDPDPALDERCWLDVIDIDGTPLGRQPWARLGFRAVNRLLPDAGLAPGSRWRVGERCFMSANRDA